MICIVGAARSGTTLLAEYLLGHDKRFAYASEPNYIWRYGAAFSKSDVRGKKCATRQVKKSIRKWFQVLAETNNTKYVLDKTPANSLRLEFIQEIFPDAIFIHLVRDGRNVLRSAMDEWCGLGRSAKDGSKYRQLPPLTRICSTVKRFAALHGRVRDLRSGVEILSDVGRLKNLILRNVNPDVPYLWGPRVPGLNEVFLSRGLAVACAWQWDCCVRWIEMDGRQLGKDSVLTTKFEELLNRPHDVIRDIYDHVGMEPAEAVVEKLTMLRPAKRSYDVNLDQSEFNEAVALMSHTLQFYQYI